MAEAEKEMAKGSRDPRGAKDWPISELSDTLNIVGQAASSTKGHKPLWTATLARLVDIYRAEVSRMRAADSWRMAQDAKAQRERGSSRPIDEDYED